MIRAAAQERQTVGAKEYCGFRNLTHRSVRRLKSPPPRRSRNDVLWRSSMNLHLRLRPACCATVLCAMLAGSSSASAQETYMPTKANLQARGWFEDAKVGLFIHWGVYSVLGEGEWGMEIRPINRVDSAN